MMEEFVILNWKLEEAERLNLISSLQELSIIIFSFALSFGHQRFLANSSYAGLGLKFHYLILICAVKLAWAGMAVDHSIRPRWGGSARAHRLKTNVENWYRNLGIILLSLKTPACSELTRQPLVLNVLSLMFQLTEWLCMDETLGSVIKTLCGRVPVVTRRH